MIPCRPKTIIFVSVIIIPQRYVLAIMGLLAIANAYTMRVCLNLAITQMVKRNVLVEGDEHFDPLACEDLSLVGSVSVPSNSSAVDVDDVRFLKLILCTD